MQPIILEGSVAIAPTEDISKKNKDGKLLNFLIFSLESGFSSLIDAEKTSPSGFPSVDELHEISLNILKQLMTNQKNTTIGIEFNDFHIELTGQTPYPGKNEVVVNVGKSSICMDDTTFFKVLTILLQDIFTKHTHYTDNHINSALNFILDESDKTLSDPTYHKFILHILNNLNSFVNTIAENLCVLVRHSLNNRESYPLKAINNLVNFVLCRTIVDNSEPPLATLAINVINNQEMHDYATVRCARHFLATAKKPFSEYSKQIADSITRYVLFESSSTFDNETIEKAFLYTINKPDLYSDVSIKETGKTFMVNHALDNNYPEKIINKLITFVVRTSKKCFDLKPINAAQMIILNPAAYPSPTEQRCAQHLIATQSNFLEDATPDIIIAILGYILPETGKLPIGITHKKVIETISHVLDNYDHYITMPDKLKLAIFWQVCRYKTDYPKQTTRKMLRSLIGMGKEINALLHQNYVTPSTKISAAMWVIYDTKPFNTFKDTAVEQAVDCILTQFIKHAASELDNAPEHSPFIHNTFQIALNCLFEKTDHLFFSETKRKHLAVIINYIFKYPTFHHFHLALANFVVCNSVKCQELTPEQAVEKIIIDVRTSPPTPSENYRKIEFQCACLFIEANPHLFSCKMFEGALTHITNNIHHYPPNTCVPRALAIIEKNKDFFEAPKDQATISHYFYKIGKLDVLQNYSDGFFNAIFPEKALAFEKVKILAEWNDDQHEEMLSEYPSLVSYIVKKREHEVFNLWRLQEETFDKIA